MNALINKSETKKYALWAASHYRPFVGFTRVSEEFLTRIDGKLRNVINSEIRSLPSKGVTIK